MISAKSFWDAFSSKLRSACSNDPNWRQYFANATKWTNFVMSTLTNSVGKELGFDPENEIQKEFYKIDVIYYRVHVNPQAAFFIPNGAEWNWDLEIAIEHENNSKDWHFEFSKLCHINCGLKVIIGYHEYGNQQKYGTIEQKLDYMKTLYDLRKYKQGPEDNWLLILGPNDLARDFVAYKFDGKEFSRLEDKRILQQ